MAYRRLAGKSGIHLMGFSVLLSSIPRQSEKDLPHEDPRWSRQAATEPAYALSFPRARIDSASQPAPRDRIEALLFLERNIRWNDLPGHH